MVVKKILLLGNPRLYDISNQITKDEVRDLEPVIVDLHDTMMDFREKYGAGRAIAAPQIGVFKRLIYMNIDNQATVMFNPRLENMSEEMFEVWDDCMSFPELLVKVLRHRSCQLVFRDENWNEKSLNLKDDLSELLQHEYDHLDGILAVQRAIDDKSFTMRSQKEFLIKN